MTTQQVITLSEMLERDGKVLDRVYWSKEHKSINFRAAFDVLGLYNNQYHGNRLAIIPDGTIVDRNIHHDFIGIRP